VTAVFLNVDLISYDRGHGLMTRTGVKPELARPWAKESDNRSKSACPAHITRTVIRTAARRLCRPQ